MTTHAPKPAQAATTFVEQASALARTLGGAHHPTLEQIEEAVACAPVVPLTSEEVEVLALAVLGLEPFSRVLACLLMLRQLAGDRPHGARWRPFAAIAVEALFRVGRVDLFALRLQLLDALVAVERQSERRAFWLQRRANTRMGLNPGEPEQRTLAVQDLREALPLCRKVGDAGLEVQIQGTWARVEAMNASLGGPEAQGQLTAAADRMKGVLDLARSAGQAGDVLEMLAEFEGLLAQRGDRSAAARSIDFARQAAAEETPDLEDRAARRITLAEALSTRGTEADRPEAIRIAREVLESLPPGGSERLAIRTLSVLGLALAQAKEAREAVVHLEHALQLQSRQAPSPGRNLVRVKLAESYANLGRATAARHAANTALEDAKAIHDRAAIADATHLLARLDDGAGAPAAAEAHFKAAEASVSDTVEEAVLVLDRMAHAPAPPSYEEIALWMRRYARRELPDRPDVETFADTILGNHAERISDDVKALLLRPGSPIEPKPNLRARLLDTSGHRREAIEELRRGMAPEQQPLERLRSAGLLVALLPRGAHRERLECCDLIESMLEGANDIPAIRLNLASALRMSAQGDPGILDRAWGHATRAAERLPGDPHTAEVSARARAAIRLAQLEAAPECSSPQQLERAAWFETPLPLPAAELAEARQKVALLLSFPGPLAHPDALALAERLLELASGPPAPASGARVRERLRWVRTKVDHPDRAAAKAPKKARCPFDSAPDWAVALAHGNRPAVVKGELDDSWILVLILARPDRAGAVLSWLVERGDEVPGLLQTLIQRAPEDVLRRLVEPVEAAAGSGAPFGTLKLRALLYQALRDRDRSARAADDLLAAARTPEERIEARWLKGLERMDYASERWMKADAPEAAVMEARTQLSAAVEEARARGLPPEQWFHVLVSTGNAFRAGNEPLLDRALELYGEAERMGSRQQYELAKLWKVTADALVERGAPGDAERALKLVDRSLEIRREGYLRVEALITASHAEEAQTSRDEPSRLRRALARLDEARRHDDGRYTRGLAKLRLSLLGQLARIAPADRQVAQALDEIERELPDLAEDVARARRGVVGLVTPDQVEGMKAIWSHPATRAYHEAMGPFGSPDYALAKKMSRQLGLSLEKHPELLGELRDGSPEARSPEWRRKHADGLARVEDAGARPGAATGRARVLARMAEHGEATAAEVRAAAEEAEALVRGIREDEPRRYLLLELTRVWGPKSHDSHPVADFAHAATLAKEVLDECGPGGAMARQALLYLARDTRYRTDGEGIRAHLLEAEALNERLLRECEAAGDLEAAAIARYNLSEVRHELRAGGGDAADQANVEALRQQREQLDSDRSRAQLAVGLTDRGAHLGTPEGTQLLLEAKELFEAVDWSRLEPGEQRMASNWHTMSLAELAVRRGDRGAAIALWRERVASLDRGASNKDWGYAIHNLADMLLRPGGTAGEAVEALELLEQALLVRPLKEYPRQHWETNFSIGLATLDLIQTGLQSPRWPFPVPSRVFWERGRRALLAAIEAARGVDASERLLRAAVLLMELAIIAPTQVQLEQAAEGGWRALDEARPLVLLDEGAGHLESEVAAKVAVSLAVELAETGLVGVAAESLGTALDSASALPAGVPRFVLSGEGAQRVLRWMVRATGGAQRRLAGRTARPAQVPPAIWGDWLAAIKGSNLRALQLVLEKVRKHAPEFLRGEPGLEATWGWLQARPGSIAVSVLGTQLGTLVAILEADGRRRVTVAALEPEPPSGIPLDDAARGPELGRKPYAALLDWARRQFLAPLRTLLPPSPAAVLWVPVGPLRLLAPSDLWPGCPVTCSARLDLEVRPSMRRPRSTLVAVADPGPGNDGARPIRDAMEAGARMAELAGRVGPVRALLGQGARFGEVVAKGCPGVIGAQVTPDGLLRELGEADAAVLLCHGQYSGPSDADLLLLDAGGATVRLDVARIAEDPTLLSGLTVVLLSCATGRVGDWLHRAAGLSGALLAGGARSVVAPLWPVLSPPAIDAGQAVLQALAAGGDVSEALHRLLQAGGEGRPSLQAFVHWTG